MKTPRSFLIGLAWLNLVLTTFAAPTNSLETDFQHPPASARPWVHWFPLSGNCTKAGITADMEALARGGFGGVLYMEAQPDRTLPLRQLAALDKERSAQSIGIAGSGARKSGRAGVIAMTSELSICTDQT